MHSEMVMVVGDGAYAGRPQCALVAAVGAVPRFLPRRNATLKGEGVRAWTEMLLSMAENPQQWFREYYQREASECGLSMVKNRKGALRKRLDRRKETETYLRFVQHNATRLA
jgi:transposase